MSELKYRQERNKDQVKRSKVEERKDLNNNMNTIPVFSEFVS